MLQMKPRWDQSNQRWETSVGSGKARRWFRSRVHGEEGREIVLRKAQAFLDPPGPPEGSLAWFVELFWWPLTKPTLAERSVESYKSDYENHIRALEFYPLKALRLPVMQTWVNELGKTRQPKTVRKIFGVLTAILNLAAKMTDEQNLPYYPYRDHEMVKLPAVPKVARPILSLREIDLLLKRVSGTSMEGPIWAAATLGIRRNELGGLKVPHITFKQDLCIITLQDNRQSKGRENPKLKNKPTGEKRVLSVPRSMGEKLLSFAKPNSLYVFTIHDGTPISLNSVTKAVPMLCDELKITRIPLKNLRHSCASRLRASGVPETMIKDILGHTTVAMTGEYLQTQESEMADAFARASVDGS